MASNSEPTIMIKVKTLDSQTYTLQVNKHIPIANLKNEIATFTGISSDQQRLIYRGRVLHNDQLLSFYQVEDGHVLHLVERQPVPPLSSGTLPTHPGQSDVPNFAFGFQERPSFVHSHAFPDSLGILAENLNHLRRAYDTHLSERMGVEARASEPVFTPSLLDERLPRSALLARVFMFTIDLLRTQVSESLRLHWLQLQDETVITNPLLELLNVFNAWSTGALLHDLGSFLLELGRTTMRLQLTETSSRAVVGSGPAVFISRDNPTPFLRHIQTQQRDLVVELGLARVVNVSGQQNSRGTVTGVVSHRVGSGVQMMMMMPSVVPPVPAGNQGRLTSAALMQQAFGEQQLRPSRLQQAFGEQQQRPSPSRLQQAFGEQQRPRPSRRIFAQLHRRRIPESEEHPNNQRLLHSTMAGVEPGDDLPEWDEEISSRVVQQPRDINASVPLGENGGQGQGGRAANIVVRENADSGSVMAANEEEEGGGLTNEETAALYLLGRRRVSEYVGQEDQPLNAAEHNITNNAAGQPVNSNDEAASQQQLHQDDPDSKRQKMDEAP